MITRRITGCALAILLGLVLASPAWSATTEDGVFITNRSEIPIRLQRPGLDISTVKRVDFWQTNDLGRSWLLVRSVEVDADTTQMRDIRYTFRPRNDGRYGFRICVHLHDGSSDPEPRSGTPPATSDMIEIATERPDVVRFTASRPSSTEDSDSEALAVNIAWAIRSMHPGRQPGILQWSSDGTSWQDHEQGLGVHGSRSLTLDPSARWVRLRARDLAGNQRLSDPIRVVEEPTAPVVTEHQEGDPEIPSADSVDESAETADEISLPPLESVVLPPSDDPNGPESIQPSEETAAARQADDTAAAADPVRARLPSREELLAALERQQASAQATDSGEINPADYLPVMPEVPDDHQDIIEPFRDRAPASTSYPAASEASSKTPAGATSSTPVPHQVIAPPPAQDSEALLNQALQLMREERLHEAQAVFRHLRGTAVYQRSLPREMETLRLLGRFDEALAIYRAAPPSVKSDTSTIARARVLLSLQQAQEALEYLALVPHHSDQAQERTFLAAIALSQLGRNRQARATMNSIAHHDNHWGRAARAWLARQR